MRTRGAPIVGEKQQGEQEALSPMGHSDDNTKTSVSPSLHPFRISQAPVVWGYLLLWALLRTCEVVVYESDWITGIGVLWVVSNIWYLKRELHGLPEVSLENLREKRHIITVAAFTKATTLSFFVVLSNDERPVLLIVLLMLVCSFCMMECRKVLRDRATTMNGATERSDACASKQD